MTLMLVALVAGLEFEGCSKLTEQRGIDQTLVRGLAAEPDSLDPQRAATTEAQTVLRDVCEGLTVLDEHAEAVPGSAESISTDGHNYLFHLRPGIRWSNGDPVIAEDFVAGLQRLADPATASPYAQFINAIQNANEVLSGRKPASSLGVSAPNDTTVIISLVTPYPGLLQLLSHPSTCPVHRQTLNRDPDHFGRPGTAITNGAFTAVEWIPNTQILLRPNRYYWNRDRVHLYAVKYLVVPDSNNELTRYRAGLIDITSGVSRSQFDWVRKTLGSELHVSPQLGTYYLGFAMQKPPFKDNPKLRRALYLAINRQLLVAKVLRTGELPAYGWIPPGVTDHPTQFMDPELSIDSQRIKAAKELYSEAGYSQANPFHVVLSYNSGEVHTPLALAIADMWHDTLGVRVTLVADEFKSLLQDIERGKVEVFRSSWTADVNDPSNFLQPFMQNSGVNLTHYANPRFDELIVRAQSAPDVAERRNLLGLAERVLIADAPVIPIYFYVNKHLVKRDVVGWYDNPLNVVYSRDLAFAPQLAVAH